MINDILNDESINDKQLIKELSLCVKDNYQKGRPIDEKFVLKVLDICLQNNYPLLEKINVYHDPNFFAQAGEKELYLNVDNIINCITMKEKNSNFNLGDNRIYKYYMIVSTIIHELTHLKQEYCVMENPELYQHYEYFFNLTYDDFDLYQELYDYVLIERCAAIREHKITLEVLKYIFDNDYINYLELVLLRQYINGYRINGTNNIYLNPNNVISIESPDEILRENLADYDIKFDDDNLSLYEKLHLGLPISIEEYSKFAKDYKRIYKNTKNK